MNTSSLKLPAYFTDNELALAEKYLKTANPNTSTLLEYGCGASTLYFSKYVHKYYSIEHDYGWYSEITKEILKQKIKNIQLFFIQSKCRPNLLENMDIPLFNKSLGTYIFEDYINFNTHLGMLDYVFIDGCARKHCAFSVYNNLKPSSIVLFDDFNNREYYHDILQKYVSVENADTLAILRRNQ